jgi:16S rRNA (guanine966-N2)-methyltransferase
MSRRPPAPRPLRPRHRDLAPPPPRIVGGKHRGRPLLVPPGSQVRPTAARARESLFNILMHADLGGDGTSPLPGARVLDGFAGCGALGIEALSRGAAHAVFIDSSAEAIRAIGENLRSLGETANARVIRTDATQPMPAPAGAACGLVFLDPPYRSEIGPRALAALAAAGWIAADAVCALELGAREKLEPAPGFTVIDERSYGAARIVFLRYQPS